jgi:salicylate hydroxylase
MLLLAGFRLIWFSGGIFKIHRADLQRVLLKMALAHARVHLANKLVSYTEHPDSISLEFENGSKRTCHLLVGADGIKSIVRKLFLASRPGQESSEPVWTGTYAYRGLIQRDVLLKAMPSHRVTRLPAMVSINHLNNAKMLNIDDLSMSEN